VLLGNGGRIASPGLLDNSNNMPSTQATATVTRMTLRRFAPTVARDCCQFSFTGKVLLQPLLTTSKGPASQQTENPTAQQSERRRFGNLMGVPFLPFVVRSFITAYQIEPRDFQRTGHKAKVRRLKAPQLHPCAVYLSSSTGTLYLPARSPHTASRSQSFLSPFDAFPPHERPQSKARATRGNPTGKMREFTGLNLFLFPLALERILNVQ